MYVPAESSISCKDSSPINTVVVGCSVVVVDVVVVVVVEPIGRRRVPTRNGRRETTADGEGDDGTDGAVDDVEVLVAVNKKKTVNYVKTLHF